MGSFWIVHREIKSDRIRTSFRLVSASSPEEGIRQEFGVNAVQMIMAQGRHFDFCVQVSNTDWTFWKKA